jgi:hypothetical protein
MQGASRIDELTYRTVFMTAIEEDRCAEVAQAFWDHRGVALADGRLEVEAPPARTLQGYPVCDWSDQEVPPGSMVSPMRAHCPVCEVPRYVKMDGRFGRHPIRVR